MRRLHRRGAADPTANGAEMTTETKALLNRAVGLHKASQFDQAATAYLEVLQQAPDHFDALHLLGVLRIHQGRPQEGVALIVAALALRPGSAEAHFNLGVGLDAIGKLDDAIAAYDGALAHRPDYAEALNNRGNVLGKLARYEEAADSYARAVKVKPGYADARYNHGLGLIKLNRPEAAISSFEALTAMCPNHIEGHFSLGLARLQAGSFATGWPEYEWRLKRPNRAADAGRFDQPRWSGKESLSDKVILVHAEQGFGDVIMFVRFLPHLAQAAKSVILEVPLPLKPLLEGCAGAAQTIARGEKLPPFDLHCPLMSLALAFDTRLETIPAEVPYLRAPQERLAQWQARLANMPQPRVGIAWSGSEKNTIDGSRSLTLDAIAALRASGLPLISLQKELRDHDRKTLEGLGDIRHFGDELRDFADTAALISQLDLVVSVDTSVAHLAGALGKPVWILLPFSADWRWLTDRGDSPWYPTARLFRQPAIGEWGAVIARVGSELKGLTGGGSPVAFRA